MSEQASSSVVPQRHLVVRAVLRTDVGLVRSENQDFGTYTTENEEKGSHPGGRLLIVADGMGGHRGGATASRLAGETVKAQYLGSETTNVGQALRDALARANARIFTEAQTNPELRGMGTTTSVLAVRDAQGWLAHVGDSRIYLIREGEISQLTEDHSLVATMVREGLLTPAEAETHPRRNVLQRSMGVADDVEIDVRGPFELREGDTFVLCSDGLHGLVKEPELKEIAGNTIDEAADEFLRKALERGAPDNVTVIVARVEVTDEMPEYSIAHGGPEEDTQPLEPIEPSQFDETVKETTGAHPKIDQSARITDKIPAITDADIDDTQPIATAPAVPEVSAPAPAGAAEPKRPVLRWALVVVLALGAAGAWYFWTHQQALSEGAPSTSTR
ncbi:MAG TPA: Stp1/IreP family PP2C-type Ser/Thr phosphatase [Thermoanaerobaculia bacterium]|nr:Stp1/IreP family PP2C-type Ser/Thr phosphatase [Thermoanaerobaculia bacterium]